MTLDSSTMPLANNYAPANFRQQTNGMMGGDVFGGPYQIQTPSGKRLGDLCRINLRVLIRMSSYHKLITNIDTVYSFLFILMCVCVVGIVHSTQQSSQIAPPPLPPRPNSMLQSSSSSMFSPYGNNNSYGSYGGGFGSAGYGYGMSGMNGMGFGGFNSFSGYGNNYGRPAFGNPLDPEMRFIQMAEESSRSTFQSIESIVSTIGNIATMLDSTYFALTSSFRAILGLAANFSHLRGFFARFFSTFTIFRSVMWIYKKLLYMVGISRVNPSTQINLNEAFKDAEKVQSNDFFNSAASQQNSSGLAMVLFLTFVFTAPYLIMKLFGSLMNTAADQCKFF